MSWNLPMSVSKEMAKFSSAGTLQPWSPKIPPAERIPLNNTEFLQKKKIKINLFYKSSLPPTQQGLRWAWNSPCAKQSPVSMRRHRALCTQQEGRSQSRARVDEQGSHWDLLWSGLCASMFCRGLNIEGTPCVTH